MSTHSVLIVSPIASHPPDQGNAARIQAEATELRRRGIAVDFFYYGMEGLSQEQFDAMNGFWRRFFFLRSEALPPPSLPRTWGIDDWCSDNLCEQVANVCRKHSYDAVIVNYVWMSKILDALPPTLKVIDTHDLFGDRHLVAEGSKLVPRWYFTTVPEENLGFARADVVIGIQSVESGKIAARHSGRTITVGHPIEPHFLLRRRPGSEPAFRFGYIGSGNPFNVASVTAIDRAIAEIGGLSWTLAGTISRRQLDLVSHPYRMGTVDQLKDFYDNVDCVLNPMMGGTGLKIKTIEALAFGRPIIGTVDAFEGIESRHRFHQLREIVEVAAAMREYEQSPTLRRELQSETYRVFARYMAEVSTQYDRFAALIRGTRQSTKLAGAA
jgi:hypothetical protein